MFVCVRLASIWLVLAELEGTRNRAFRHDARRPFAYAVTLMTSTAPAPNPRQAGMLAANAGLLARFYGGFCIQASTTENIGYRQRQHLNEAAKLRIARTVAAEV